MVGEPVSVVAKVNPQGEFAKRLVSSNPHGLAFDVEFDIAIDAHRAAFRWAADQLGLSSEARARPRAEFFIPWKMWFEVLIAMQEECEAA